MYSRPLPLKKDEETDVCADINRVPDVCIVEGAFAHRLRIKMNVLFAKETVVRVRWLEGGDKLKDSD